MYQKVKIIIFLAILLVFFSGIFPLAAQTTLKFSAKGGLNLSRPVAIPEDLSTNGNSYKVHYVPGYDWAGLLKIDGKALSFASGIGYKSLNFNFERNFKKKYPYSISESFAIIRLKYWYIPVNINVHLIPKNKLFISLSAEFCRLVNDVNYEIIERAARAEKNNEVLKWYKRQTLFIFLRGGFNINPKTIIVFGLGMTPKRVEQKEIAYEGDIHGSYFYFSKKQIEFRIAVIYDIFTFKF